MKNKNKRKGKLKRAERLEIAILPTQKRLYEFYQYWINADDRDVVKFLSYFTFLPQEEILSFKKDSLAEIRKAKEVLAFETTKLTHGEEEAVKAKNSAKAVFANTGDCVDSVPVSEIDEQRIKKGISITGSSPLCCIFYKNGYSLNIRFKIK